MSRLAWVGVVVWIALVPVSMYVGTVIHDRHRPPPDDPRDWVCVTSMADDDWISRRHVESLLQAHSIRIIPVIHFVGSGLEPCDVHASDRRRATAILQQDECQHYYSITETTGRDRYPGREWIRYRIDMAYAKAAVIQSHRWPPMITTFLNAQQVRRLANDEWHRRHVDTVQFSRRDFLDDGEWKVGYDVEVGFDGLPPYYCFCQFVEEGAGLVEWSRQVRPEPHLSLLSRVQRWADETQGQAKGLADRAEEWLIK